MQVDPGQTLSHYRLIEKIGEGGMGVVWKALDTKLDREVALKLLSERAAADPRRLREFAQEARLVAVLNHPNIVTVYSVEHVRDLHFITMELIRGTDLGREIQGHGLVLARIFELILPIVEAVRAAHDRGIVHGDLKPGNVMVGEDGRTKILDFGLARTLRPPVRAATDDDPTRTLSVETKISGTVPYMSPEQIQGKPIDGRSDIFALGLVLYEMTTGRHPFRGETTADVIAAVLKDVPRPPSSINPELPRQLDRIIALCLEKDPAKRLQSTRDLLEDLRTLQRSRVSGEGSARSIAVLPFVDLSADHDQDYFCEGMTDEILNALSRIDDLQVASRTSSSRFKSTTLDSREIGDLLGVSNLLEGSVRKAGDRLRITVQLINVLDGYHLWSERYDRRLEDVFAIQDEIAQNIVDALAVRLSPRERRAIKQVATADFHAYDLYLRGRQYFRQFRRKSIEFASTKFEQAIEVDPAYAGAWAGLADCHSYLYMFWAVTEEHLNRADEASRKAVELDPDLAEAYVARGVAISIRGEYDEADVQFETAMRLNPGQFEAYYFAGRNHYARGSLEKAVDYFERAIEARPEDYQSPSLLGSALSGLGRMADSREAFVRALDRATRHLEVHPGDARALYFGALAMCQIGGRETESLDWAGRALVMDPDEPQVLYNVACVYALLGKRDAALERLAETIAHGGWWKTWMKNDPDLSCLHDEPRFQALVE